MTALLHSWPASTVLKAPEWEPSLDQIRARLKSHAEYSGRAGMQPTEIAKDCDYLLQLVEQFVIVDGEA